MIHVQGVVEGNATGATTVVVPIATPTSGRRLVLQTGWRGDGITASPPTGWTEICPVTSVVDADADINFQAWERVADGTEGTTITVTFSATAKAVASVHEFYDAGGTLVLDVDAVATGTGTASSVATGALTSSDSYVVGFITHTGVPGTLPSGTSETGDLTEDGRAQTSGDTGATRHRALAMHLIVSADSTSKTNSAASSNSQDWIAYVAAYHVDAGGGSTIDLTPDPVLLNLALPVPGLAHTLILSPDPVLLNLAVPVPTLEVTGGTIDLTPDPVLLNLAVPVPTLGHVLGLTPAPVPLELGVPDPALTHVLSLAPDPVLLELAVPVPSLTHVLSLTPAPVALQLTVPAPTIDVVGGSINLMPEPVLLTLSVPVPVLSHVLSLAPDPVALGLGLPQPSLSQILTLTPDPVVFELGVSQPTLAQILTLSPDPVLFQLLMPVPTLEGGDVAFDSGSDHDLLRDSLEYFAAFDLLTTVAERRALQLQFLLDHGAMIVVDRKTLERVVVGGFYPVRFTP